MNSYGNDYVPYAQSLQSDNASTSSNSGKLHDRCWNSKPRADLLDDDESSFSWYNQKPAAVATLPMGPTREYTKPNYRAHDFHQDESKYSNQDQSRLRYTPCTHSHHSTSNERNFSRASRQSSYSRNRIHDQDVVSNLFRLESEFASNSNAYYKNDQKIPHDMNRSFQAGRGEHFKERTDSRNFSKYKDTCSKNSSQARKSTSAKFKHLPPASSHHFPPRFTTESDKVSSYDDSDYQQKVKEYQAISMVGSGASSVPEKVAGKDTVMVEIEPGYHERLRGAEETFDAVKRDYYVPTDCVGCGKTIFCIQDATYVCCPYTSCHVLGPNFNRVPFDGSEISCYPATSTAVNGGGVGLGFTFKDLADWQADILRETTLVLKEQSIAKASSRPQLAAFN